MSIVKTEQVTTFRKLERSTPFSCTMVLHSRSEKEKEYRFFKTGRNRAITTDKHTAVHFIGNEQVTVWRNEDHQH